MRERNEKKSFASPQERYEQSINLEVFLQRLLSMKIFFVVFYISVILSIASCTEQSAEKAAPQPAQPKAEISGVLQPQDTPQAHVSGETASPSENARQTTEHLSGQ